MKKLISGTAIVFNSPSHNMGGYKEVILPTALDNVDLSEVKLLVNHDHSQPVASVKGETLTLELDETGLHYVAEVDEDLASKVEQSLFDKMSFGFVEGKSTVKDKVKYVEKIDNLFEVSLVSIPAYQETQAQVVAERGYEILTRSLNLTATAQQGAADKGENNMLNTNQKFIEVLKQRSITTTEIGEVAEVLAPIFEEEGTGLETQVNKVATKAGSGTIPVLNPNAVLPNVAELAEASDLDVSLDAVRFEVATYRGIIPISQEAIDDAGEGIVNDIKKYTGTLKSNTINAEIAKVMKAATAGTATAAELRGKLFAQPVSEKTSIVVSQSLYTDLVDLTDGANNYLVKEGKFAGFDIFVVDDAVFGKAGDKKAYVGDLSRIVVIERTDIELDWFNHSRYGRMLQPVLRFDVVDTNANAKFITVS